MSKLLRLSPLLSIPGLLVGGWLLAGEPVPSRTSPVESLSFQSTALPAAFAAAGEALRRRDCSGALSELEPATRQGSAGRGFALLVQGLHAHACEEVELAEQRLFEAGGEDTPLEDWRLLILGDSAAALGHTVLARAALARLLAGYPDSPLRPRAFLAAASRAWERGDAPAALDLTAQGRAEPEIAGETLTRLDLLAWEIGRARGDAAVQIEAGRRLLAHDPAKAREEGIEEALRSLLATETPASLLLDRSQLLERAQGLLDAGLAAEARASLLAVAPAARELDWALLYAAVLTRERRGKEALSALADALPRNRGEEARLHWARAMAARDRASAFPGRENLPAAQRADWRLRFREHLDQVAASGGDHDLAVEALRLLYADLDSEDRFDEAMTTLRRLRAFDPDDATGAAPLWQRGWEAFRARNYSTAVGYWSELGDLYPENRHARSGRYWTARAFEALGNGTRARQIYREVAAADTTDFYRRYALARLDRESQAVPPSQEPAPWPRDRSLDRARLLSDLGLDDLALAEIEAVGKRAAPAAAAALESLVYARRGERRESIRRIRAAFPALGSPYQAGVPGDALLLYYPLVYGDEIRRQADLNGLPHHLVFGMIRQESGFDPQATSRAGARGLMQVMPATGREVAQRLGLRYSTDQLHDPAYNVRLGTSYFRQVLGMFDGNEELALAGYNGGPYRIRRLWREAGQSDTDRFLEGLSIQESRDYVKRIILLSDSYQRLYPDGRG